MNCNSLLIAIVALSPAVSMADEQTDQKFLIKQLQTENLALRESLNSCRTQTHTLAEGHKQEKMQIALCQRDLVKANNLLTRCVNEVEEKTGK